MTPTKHQQNWLPGIFNDFFGNEWIAKTNSAAPAINIVETDKEYEVQIAAPGITKDDFEIILKVILFTGLRESEALGLTWDSVDFKAGTLKVSKQLQKRRLADGGATLSPTKNGKCLCCLRNSLLSTVARIFKCSA